MKVPKNSNNEARMDPSLPKRCHVPVVAGSCASPGFLVRHWRQLPLQFKGMVVVAIPLCALLVASLLGAVVAQQHTRAVAWTEHSYQVRVSVQEVYTQVTDASTSVRGFLLTGEARFLDPYRLASRRLLGSVHQLEALVGDNPEQLARARRVTGHVRAQLGTWRLMVARQPSSTYLRLLSISKGEIDSLRNLLGSMSRSEDRLLAQRKAVTARWQNGQRALGIGNLLIGLMGGYLAMLLFLRGIVRRTEYVEANAERLAQGQPLSPPIPGDDALSRLSERLDTTAKRLRQQTQQLFESESRLRHVVSNAPVILQALDHEGRFIFSEGQSLKAIGRKPGELVGRSVFEIYHDKPQILTNNRSALAGNSLTTTLELGSATFETRYVPVFQDGVVTSVIVIGIDVTERKQAERVLVRYQEALERQNAELVRVSELKDEFVAKMSHELRTPLTAVIGFAELLRDEEYVGAVNRRQRDYIDIILDASAHLLTLINDLLDLSKIEAGMMQLEAESLDLLSAVSNALSIIEGAARKKALRLEVRLPTALEPLSADARKVRQILYNLLSNAVKYTPSAGQVQLIVIDQASEVLVEVRDSGPGIAPEDQLRLFQPFVQLGNTSNYEGTGLGLALTKQLVELHGGRVWLRSRVGKGSTFGFSLPRSGVTGPEATSAS